MKCVWNKSKHKGKDCPIHNLMWFRSIDSNLEEELDVEDSLKLDENIEEIEKTFGKLKLKSINVESLSKNLVGTTIINDDGTFDIKIESDKSIYKYLEYPKNKQLCVIYHEIGHIITKDLIYPNENKEIKKKIANIIFKEQKRLVNLLGSYIMSDYKEFLADVIAYHYALPDYDEAMEKCYNIIKEHLGVKK